jgi:GDP-4-dehydro-6-deoxy-D-mannose reductase
MPHRALITGASGFAGGFLAEHLLESGDVVLGCSPDGAWEAASPEAIREPVKLVAWDLGRADGLDDEARRRIEAFRPEVIYHLAALSVPRDCGAEEPAPAALAVNVGGTGRVLRLAASLAPSPRVLFVSSSHVYAPVDREKPRVDESSPLGPTQGYGQTKLAAEREVRRAVEQDGTDAVVVRAFQHTGPRQVEPMMLPEWVRQFAAGGGDPVEVHTCDAQIDLSDVRDVVRAYRLLAERGRRGEIYNVGSGVPRSSGDVLDILRELAAPDRPIDETQPGFKQDPIADITRLVRATGWRPLVSIDQTVADTLAYWRRRLR